ncbi:MAG: hypothetical protein QW734_03640 [Candidatus Bathyarchaeia archaeon]
MVKMVEKIKIVRNKKRNEYWVVSDGIVWTIIYKGWSGDLRANEYSKRWYYVVKYVRYNGMDNEYVYECFEKFIDARKRAIEITKEIVKL